MDQYHCRIRKRQCSAHAAGIHRLGKAAQALQTGSRTLDGTVAITAGNKTVTLAVEATILDTDILDDNTFTMSDGLIVMNAEHYADSTANSGTEWSKIEGLGRMGSTMKMFPTTESFDVAGEGPSLTYRVSVPESGEYTLTAYVGPSNNVYADAGVQYGVSVDGGAATAVNTINKDGEDKYVTGDSNPWSSSIRMAGRTAESKHNLEAGIHTITIYGMDAGLLLEKLVLSKDPLKTSHLGPEETWYKGKNRSRRNWSITRLRNPWLCRARFMLRTAGMQSRKKHRGMLCKPLKTRRTHTRLLSAQTGPTVSLLLVNRSRGRR